jgi:hypothetical protein
MGAMMRIESWIRKHSDETLYTYVDGITRRKEPDPDSLIDVNHPAVAGSVLPRSC